VENNENRNSTPTSTTTGATLNINVNLLGGIREAERTTKKASPINENCTALTERKQRKTGCRPSEPRHRLAAF
jgi:hypothetical protein